MPIRPEDVVFYYDSPQGRFIVHYSIHGHANVYACGVPDGAGDAPPEDTDLLAAFSKRFYIETGGRPALHSWRQHHGVESDRERLTETELIQKYRRIFTAELACNTDLETPAMWLLDRLMFPVTLWTGDIVTVVLRADGFGYVEDTVEWKGDGLPGEQDDDATWFTARFPTSFFQHDLTHEQILRDAEILSRTDERGVLLLQNYQALFWDNLNRGLPTPWIRHFDEIQDRPIKLENGTEQELRSLMADMARLDESAWQIGRAMTIVARCGMGDRKWISVGFDGDNNRFSVQSRHILQTLLTWSQPCGYFVKQRSGTEKNWSGFIRLFATIEVTVDPPSATERMEALEHLICWSERTGINVLNHLPS